MASPTVRKVILPGIVFAAFWAPGVTTWRLSGYPQPLALFGCIGSLLGVGLYALLPKKRKQRARRLTLLLAHAVPDQYHGVRRGPDPRVSADGDGGTRAVAAQARRQAGRARPIGAVAAATAAAVWAGTLLRPLPVAADAGDPPRATIYPHGDSIGSWGRGFGYGLTLSLDQARDDLLAPLRWSGPGLGLKSSWTWGGGDTRQVLSLTIPLSLLSNRFGHEGYALAPTVAYGYLEPIRRRGAGSRVWAGGRLRLDMFNGYYESWDDQHLYWLTAYSVGPTFAWRGRAQGLTAWLDLDAPLVAAVSRPHADRTNQMDRLTKLSGHFVDTQKDLRFATLPEYAALHATAGVLVHVAGRSLALSYDLDWSTYASPSRVTVLAHRLTVGHRASR